MFVGSINQDVRAILRELAGRWVNRPVYVGCSGNFTVERICAQAGVQAVHGNDVSIYTCTLGRYLTDAWTPVTLKDPDAWHWLQPYVEPGLSTIATIMMCTDFLQYSGRSTAYHKRMAGAYRQQWPDLHARTIEKLKKDLDGFKLASFYAGDVVDFVETVPDDAVLVSFPPTYADGYEKLYAALEATFEWDKPAYVTFDNERFTQFTERLMSKQTWVTLRDGPVPDLDPYCIARVQTGARSKPVHVFSCEGRARVTAVSQHTEPVLLERLHGEIAEGRVSLVRLSAPQLNHLRSQYLATGIIPAGAQLNLGVLVDGKLTGAIAFSRPTYGGAFCDAYMMTDLAIAPTIYPRLSKLVLAVVLSAEVKALLEQSMNARVTTIGTTAFTKKPVSMKYRGLFTLFNRKDGQLNYNAAAGKWTLQEAFAWWQKTHGDRIAAKEP